MKRLLSVMLAIFLLIPLCAVSAEAREQWIDDYFYGKGTPYYLRTPTKEQVIAKARELDIDLGHIDGYAEDYSLTPGNYKLGKLDQETYSQALNLLNYYRYVAGLPSDVEIKQEFNELAQAGMLLNAINDELTHTPARPAGMSDELYNKGLQGANSCNIAWNHTSLSLSIENGWMDDSNASNIDHAGHRRWILNPCMKYTGFGEVDKYTAMYLLDRSREGRFAGGYIAWPAANTPLEMFVGSLFTVSLGAQYDDPVLQNISITVSSETQGKTWKINSRSTEGQLYVDTRSYGIDRCIIFKAADFTEDDTLRIRIDGITRNGSSAPIEYTANIFSLTTIGTDRNTIMIKPGQAADYNVTASSLLSKETPHIRWRSADPQVCEVWLYNGRPVYYGKAEGRTTITVYTGGAFADVDVIVKNSSFILGDADDDGEVTVLDVTLLQRYLSLISTSQFCDYLCDVDHDDDISATDVTMLQRWLAEALIGSSDIGTSQISPFTR